jgi:hypothetical protein
MLTIANTSPVNVAGVWERFVVETMMAQDLRPRLCTASNGSNLRVIPVRVRAPDLQEVDVCVHLDPYEVLRLDSTDIDVGPCEALVDWGAEPLALPTDPLIHFGGPLFIGGEPATVRAFRVAGAHFEIDAVARIASPLGVAQIRMRYAPGSAWADAEMIVYCQDVSRHNLGVVTVQFGDSMVFLGNVRPPHGTLGPTSVQLPVTGVRGQAHYYPLRFFWPRLCAGLPAFVSNLAAAQLHITGHGVRRLHPRGTPPMLPTRSSAAPELNANLVSVLLSGGTLNPPIGPSRRSADTGEQEDQLFDTGILATRRPTSGAATGRLYAACYTHALRPSNYVDSQGDLLDLDEATARGSVIWDGRPFNEAARREFGFIQGLPSPTATQGWDGPDTQHWLVQSLTCAVRLTPSWAAQRLLRQQAMLYLAMRTATPGAGTTGSYSAREWGYEGLLVVAIWRNMTDRDLAERVRVRFWLRAASVFVPMMGNTRSYLHAHGNDPRLGTGDWTVEWQEALGAYGYGHALEFVPGGAAAEGVTGPARAACLRVAERIVMESMTDNPDDGVIVERSLDGRTKPFDRSFKAFGFPLAAALVLRYAGPLPGPAERRAAVWLSRLITTARETLTPKLLDWVPPEAYASVDNPEEVL